MKFKKNKLRSIIREVITDIDTGRSSGGGEDSYAPPPSPTEEEVREVLPIVIPAIERAIDILDAEWDDDGTGDRFHIDDYIDILRAERNYESIFSYALDYLDNEGIISLEGSSGYYVVVDQSFFQMPNYE